MSNFRWPSIQGKWVMFFCKDFFYFCWYLTLDACQNCSIQKTRKHPVVRTGFSLNHLWFGILSCYPISIHFFTIRVFCSYPLKNQNYWYHYNYITKSDLRESHRKLAFKIMMASKSECNFILFLLLVYLHITCR